MVSDTHIRSTSSGNKSLWISNGPAPVFLRTRRFFGSLPSAVSLYRLLIWVLLDVSDFNVIGDGTPVDVSCVDLLGKVRWCLIRTHVHDQFARDNSLYDNAASHFVSALLRWVTTLDWHASIHWVSRPV